MVNSALANANSQAFSVRRHGVILFTLAALLPLHMAGLQSLDHFDQAKQVLDPEGTATSRHSLKWIRWRNTRPAYGHVAEPAAVVPEVNAILAPGLLVRDQLEVSA